MIKAQIVGATGYGGLGMTELLSRHPEIKVVSLLARTETGKPVSDLFPHLRGICDMMVEDATPERIGTDADLVIFATPDGVGQAAAKQIVDAGKRMIDYSGDFRFGTEEKYQEYAKLHPTLAGKPHAAPDALASSSYGIPELYRSQIAQVKVVGNPGCFAVSMILGMSPAIKAKLVDPRSIISDGKTGISGAGKKPSATHHFPERNENLTPYRIANHQHLIETAGTLGELGGEAIGLTFVPHLLPVTRGIVCTMYSTLRSDTTAQQVYDIYQEFYSKEPFVRVLPLGVNPGLKTVVGSNYCDISLTVDQRNGRLIVVSSIDNLLKGQAGMAMQNINVMFGFPETMGLERVPIYP